MVLNERMFYLSCSMIHLISICILKKLFIFCFFIAAGKFTHGQNLIPNGDFEMYSSCPTSVTQITLATPWMNPSIGGQTSAGTPDYFNSCSGGLVGIPYNFFGYQDAFSGVGYSGVILWSGIAPEVREYIQAPVDPLISGACYEFKMYVNLSDESQHATDAIGVYFSDTAIINIPNYYHLSFIPQITNAAGNMLDTLNWTEISANYTATGSEKYILIGNFKPDSATASPLINISAQLKTAYAYIDQVSLSICTGISDMEPSLSYSIYPNPFSDQLIVENENDELTEITLFDAVSKKIMHHEFRKLISLNTADLANGIYFYQLKTGSKSISAGKLVKAVYR
jgi:hypothetical protein